MKTDGSPEPVGQIIDQTTDITPLFRVWLPATDAVLTLPAKALRVVVPPNGKDAPLSVVRRQSSIIRLLQAQLEKLKGEA